MVWIDESGNDDNEIKRIAEEEGRGAMAIYLNLLEERPAELDNLYYQACSRLNIVPVEKLKK